MFRVFRLSCTNIVIEGEDKKHGGHGRHALNDVGNCLGLDWINGPESGARKAIKKISFSLYFF